MLLGGEGFVERSKGLLAGKEQVKEIPRQQRYAGRPSLDMLFKKGMMKVYRDKAINDAHVRYGYTLKEISDHLRMHIPRSER